MTERRTSAAHLSNAPCALNNVGYFSTGLQAKYTIDAFVPKRLGTWYVKGGVQYYHIINDALLAAQTLAGTAVVATFPQANSDVAIVSGGLASRSSRGTEGGRIGRWLLNLHSRASGARLHAAVVTPRGT